MRALRRSRSPASRKDKEKKKKSPKSKSPPPDDDKKETAKTALTSEAAAINALIAKSDGGNDLTTLRQRRMSRETPNELPESRGSDKLPRRLQTVVDLSDADAKSMTERSEINELLKQVKSGSTPSQVLRQRRKSKEMESGVRSMSISGSSTSSDVKTGDGPPGSEPPTSRTVTLPPTPSVSNDSQQLPGEPEADAEPRPSLARLRWQDAAFALAAETKQRKDEDEQTTRLEVGDRAREAYNEQAQLRSIAQNSNLKGAAARGARAAALARLQQQATQVGGVFLTYDQHAAMKQQLRELAAANKRLKEEVASVRRKHSEEVWSPSRLRVSDSKSPSLERQSSDASPSASFLRRPFTAIRNALGGASPAMSRSGNASGPGMENFKENSPAAVRGMHSVTIQP